MEENLTNYFEFVYATYIQEYLPDIDINNFSHVVSTIRNTNWEVPQTALDFNNIAVIALIESENTEDLSERLYFWKQALEALQNGIILDESYLCKAHLSIMYSLINELESSDFLSYNYFLETLQFSNISQENSRSGLIYLPKTPHKWFTLNKEKLPILLSLTNGVSQALDILIGVLYQSQFCFYNDCGLRFLHLALQFDSSSSVLNLQLGIAELCKQKPESLAYLHRANKLSCQSASSLQALYLAYMDLKQPTLAEQWKEIAYLNAQSNPNAFEWKWAEIDSKSPFTYVKFQDDLLLAVEASLFSIVTRVLIAQRDWFELELELWRDSLQSGMTVIDVGANVGVYTYSAAQLVGQTGKIIAIEPFSGCIKCLEETRRINGLEQVQILSGAASDLNSVARLSLSSSNEINTIIIDDVDSETTGEYEYVNCFTLDSLIEQERLSCVHWIKIDAEGSELKVLKGCSRILKDFKPRIIYENISKDQDTANDCMEIAEYLTSQGYELFHYVPYCIFY